MNSKRQTEHETKIENESRSVKYIQLQCLIILLPYFIAMFSVLQLPMPFLAEFIAINYFHATCTRFHFCIFVQFVTMRTVHFEQLLFNVYFSFLIFVVNK